MTILSQILDGSSGADVRETLNEVLIKATGFIDFATYGVHPSATAAFNTAAMQAAEDAATAGTIIICSVYGIIKHNGNIQYKGGVEHWFSLGTVFTLEDGVTCVGHFVPKHYFTATQAEFQAQAILYKNRPAFTGLHLNGNIGDATGNGLVLSSTEGRVTKSRFIGCSQRAILLTAYNQHGHTSDEDYNFIKNRIIDNVFDDNGEGAFKAEGESSKTTDGWFNDNSVTNGTGYAADIEEGQGWKVETNQFSAVFGAVIFGKSNHSTIRGNQVNAAGNQDTVGVRYAFHLGGLSVSYAQAICEGNTIELDYNSTAGADGTSKWIAIGYYGAGAATVNKILTLANNNVRFSGFSGTTDKTRGIRQTSNSSNDTQGVWSGNSFSSDQDASGAMTDTCIEVQAANTCIIANNSNGPNLAVVVGR